MLKAYAYLFSGVLLIVIATVLIILRRLYQIEFRNTRQQEQLEMSLRTEEQQQAATLPERSPPTYDEAVQWPVRQATRF